MKHAQTTARSESAPGAKTGAAGSTSASWARWASAVTPTQISRSGDAAEREADSAADTVMSHNAAKPSITPTRASAPVQRATEDTLALEEEPEEEAAPVLRKAESQLAPPADAPPPDLPGGGEPLPSQSQSFFGNRFGRDFSGVRIHRDAQAGSAAQGMNARAFALGHDIAFAPGQYAPDTQSGKHLIAHELAHVAQTGDAAQKIHRHPVAPTPVARSSHNDILGDGTPAHPGMTLEDFESYTRRQADWFTDPSLTAADRDQLWSLLFRVHNFEPMMAGVGDRNVAELGALPAADWTALDAFSRGCHGESHTVSIASAAHYTLMAHRIALGQTILALEALLPGEVLELTVTEQQLAAIFNSGWMPLINNYWTLFQPQIEQTTSSVDPGSTSEFQHMLDLISAPAGIAPFITLRGNIRNLHRFSHDMLTRLVQNFVDFTRARPVHLVLHTTHDAGAFQDSARLFEDLILNSPNLVLMLEGQASLAAITARVPALAAAYGQPDSGGTPRIAQVMIAGHGQARSVELAGSGNPSAVEGRVMYNSESMDLDTNRAATDALLNTLMANMDPAQARLVYAGCLVGSNPVPLGTAPADMATHIATTPSLGTYTETLGAAHGMRPGFVTAARASVGLEAASSLRDPAGNLTIAYDFDGPAFGDARDYVKSGHEPEGVMTAAVEVAVSHGAVMAETLLRVRLGAPGCSDPWWDECTLAAVNTALDGVAVGAGIDVTRVNGLAHAIGIPFLARTPSQYSIAVHHFNDDVNVHGFANDLYARLMATPTFSAAASLETAIGRFIMEQGWILNGGARWNNIIAFLDARPSLTTDIIESRLDSFGIGPASGDFFPSGAPATDGRIRFALAWLRQEPTNGDVRSFLNTQVVTGASGPELSPAVRAQLGGTSEIEILEALHRTTGTTPTAGGGSRPNANADLIPSAAHLNDILIEPHVYNAEVLPHALNVRNRPGMHGTPFAWVHRGDHVRVMGFTHGWAGIDMNGRLGFVYRTQITTP